MFEVLIIGGGVSGVSCALILGSAQHKEYAKDKKIGIIAHQKSSALQEALFNNAYGILPGKLGAEILVESLDHLKKCYPDIVQIEDEKVIQVLGAYPLFTVLTNKNSYQTKTIVVAIGASNTFAIEGLMHFIEPHKKALPAKNRIQLINNDHFVADGIYVAGTLAGCRSQLVIAAGSGASVATDILTIWNHNIPTQVHDSVKSK